MVNVLTQFQWDLLIFLSLLSLFGFLPISFTVGRWMNARASIFRISSSGFSAFQVRTVRVEKRINEIVNRLNKTKVERNADLKGN